tara:strand:+ start:736 stop:1182 length:447 start_codon:yes stop_codon:yes gene_type:complete
MLKKNHLGIALGADMNTNQTIKTSRFAHKNKFKSILILFLFIASCSIIETTIESTKKVGEAVIDETVDLGKVIISIPVDATKTIVDKIDEELHESDSISQEQKPLPQATPEEDKSIYTSLYGIAMALLVALLILIFRFVFVNLLKGYR